MLELNDVWKGEKLRGKQRWRLAGASAVLPPGRRIALLSPDKDVNRTAIRIMSGVEAPDKGAVRRIGLACWPFGSTGFLDTSSTLRQNAAFLGRIYNADAGDIASIALQLSGVKLRRGMALRRYPVVERRQLALGLTLALQFDWYFINDRLPKSPASLVPLIDSVIADRISRGSVVWATTSVGKVMDYCDAGLVLDQGQLTFYDSMPEALEAYREVLLTKKAGKRT